MRTCELLNGEREPPQMASSPWVVIKRKRESTPRSTPRSRKRLRQDETTSTARNQQTLTQTRWITDGTSKVDDDPDTTPEGIRNGARRGKLRPRDSTLTQMDFFNKTVIQEMDAELIREVEFDGMPPPPVPQVDGHHDSPRKKRKRKPSIRTTLAKIEGSDPNYNESQEYCPPGKRQGVNNINGDAIKPRKSGRIGANPLPDPEQNLALFETLLSQPDPQITPALEQKPKVEAHNPTTIEGQDENLEACQRSPLKDNPRTPSRKHIVKSSQSPESLPPSTQCVRLKSVDLCPTRSPLREMSPNVRSLAVFSSPSRRKKVSDDPVRPSDYIAFTTLKLPSSHRLSKRRPAPRKRRVEDSQTNVYSYPVSSSSIRGIKSSPRQTQDGSHPEPQSSDPLRQIETGTEEAEIPATSQSRPLGSSPPNVEDDDTLPGISEILGIPKDPVPACSVSHQQDQRHDVIDLQENASAYLHARTPQKTSAGAGTDVRTVVDDSEDGASDLGSPIANDTQFNLNLEHRTSSPSSCQVGAMGADSRRKGQTIESIGSSTADDEVDLADAVANTTTPTPRLVSSSHPQNKDGTASITEEIEEVALPTILQQQASVAGATGTQIPLNDVQYTSPPSTEPLNGDATQRSVRPLSMPHPSQISTQEGTQAYLGLSSLVHESTETQTQANRPITIKESSSMRLPMDKIPVHEGSQYESLAKEDFVPDDLATEDDEDYDLDPPSSEPFAPIYPVSKRTLLGDQGRRPSREANESRPAREDEAPDKDVDASTADESEDEDDCLDPENPSVPTPRRLRRQYSPIPGFNNDTQSNFTQNGHVTAAYIHRQREMGVLPKWFIPKPHRVPGYTGR